MGRYNLKPSRVYQTATALLESHTIAHPPPWYTTIGAVPPSEILTRPQPTQHNMNKYRSKRATRTKKASKLFRPQEIVFEEDKFRKTFYEHHPWELARPRVIVEQDGKDGQRVDWSKMQQANRPLNGESVVQRQLWLLHNIPDMTSEKAYDIARKEFYALRHEEDIERRIAKEEALSTGAYFGLTRLEIGMELEDKVYEQWKASAMKDIEAIALKRAAAYTGVGVTTEEVEATVDSPDAEEPVEE